MQDATPLLRSVGILALLFLALASAPAAGKVRDVAPGKNTLQRAVDRANPGDVLRMRKGHYRGSVVVEKRLKLWGVAGRRSLVDGRCRTGKTIAVRHVGVVLKHLKVVGAADGFESSPSAVDFTGVRGSGKARDLVLRDTCGGAGGAEYGVNVFGSTRIRILDSVARGGFTDAGFYVGGVSTTGSGSLVVKGNEAYGNTTGVIIELSRGDIRVLDNDLHDNDLPGVQSQAGILANASTGVLYSGNRVTDNGLYGIRLTAESSENVLNDNVFTGNPTDVLDQGVGNCGAGNVIGVGAPFPPC
jgi:parallel beta-helix repeat protein